MTNKEFEDFLIDDDSDEEIEEVKLDIDQIKATLSDYSNQKLCEMIVCDRYFGLEKKVSTICMEELARRRLAGDPFKYEDHIAEITKEMPELGLSATPDIRTVLNQAISRKINAQ
jgi:hypothetical protein